MAGTTSTTTNTKWQRSKQVSIMKWRWKSFECYNDRWLRVVITDLSEPPLFIVLKQSAGGQPAPAPAGAYMAQNRQYVMPQQAGATPAQLGLAASMAVAPALQQWLAANSAPPGTPQHSHHDLDNISAQINMLKEQVTQSENNLSAQHTVSSLLQIRYFVFYINHKLIGWGNKIM